MKNIMNQLRTILENQKEKTHLVTCNYANNYYGDQVCMIKKAGS